MTGLDFTKDRIMEIACVVCDLKLNHIDSKEYILHQDDTILNTMDEWCVKNHGATGLTEACRKSTITEAQAEDELLAFLQKYSKPKQSPLAGNSVYADRMFLKVYMPKIDNFLHYRLIDVSTIKELARRWNPELFHNAPRKKLVHRALDDIHESIIELKYYKQFLFPDKL
jgi:oligoribonuclease